MFTITPLKDGSFYLASTSHPISAVVDPTHGMNICGLNYHEQELIHCDNRRKASGATYGCPVLYPSPNRVCENQFSFDGREYNMPNHGVARLFPFAVTSQVTGAESAAITGRLDFCPGSSAYQAFPIHSYLELTITLSPVGLQLDYTVCNLDSISLPYGIAIHPFFKVLQGATLCCSAPWVMSMTESKLPTGDLIPTKDTSFDLSCPHSVQNLTLDHVYYHDGASITASIHWQRDGIRGNLSASGEFDHIVIYTPPDSGYFCVENQSCSTDCHNLYAAGFAQESGLTVLPAGANHSGWIRLNLSCLAL